jgi:hypothetical protein
VKRQGRSGLSNGGAEDRHGRPGLSNGGAEDRHGRRLPFDFSFDSFYSGRKQDLQDAVALESGTVRCTFNIKKCSEFLYPWTLGNTCKGLSHEIDLAHVDK